MIDQLEKAQALPFSSAPPRSSPVVSWGKYYIGPVVTFVSDLLSLMKPRVLSLLLISTWCPMVLASKGTVDFSLVLYTLFGGALVSGSAAAMNCLWEKEIDAKMERTKDRPLPAGRLFPQTAFVFSLLIGLLGFTVLWTFVNPVAAEIALFGHLFYVIVYTIWLKPWTPQNIVIGGAAGAVPPVVGWAAVTGEIGLVSLLLFLIVFLWTPPHFWALALNKNRDYQRAGIPMLPVVSGERVTLDQMLFYTLLLIPANVALVLVDVSLGWFSFVSLLLLGVIFLVKVYLLRDLTLNSKSEISAEAKAKSAWEVFGFSLVYLTAFFICLVVDSTIL